MPNAQRPACVQADKPEARNTPSAIRRETSPVSSSFR